MLPISVAIDCPLSNMNYLKIVEIPNWATVGMAMTDSSTMYNEKDIAKYSRSLST